MKKLLLASLALVALTPLASQASTSTSTELIIVGSTKHAASALHYYDSLSVESGERAIDPVPPIPVTPEHLETSLYPIETPSLTPGIVKPRTIGASALARPFFLIGYDSLSFQWLKERHHALKQIGALGFVVNVPNPKAMAELRRAAPGLEVSLMYGDDIAKNLGIQHYPLLVTRTSIEQ